MMAKASSTLTGHRARGEAAPRAFRSSDAFRTWLDANHARSSVLWIRCFKKHASHRGMSYRQALDEALCFGWIDGVVAKVDADSYAVRFTPRRATSIWSRVNIGRMAELIAQGRVTPAGLAAFNARDEARTNVYSFEREALSLAPDLAARFEADPVAWKAFHAEPPGYRRLCLFWIMSAKRDETRARRLEITMQCATTGTRIPPLATPTRRDPEHAASKSRRGAKPARPRR